MSLREHLARAGCSKINLRRCCLSYICVFGMGFNYYSIPSVKNKKKAVKGEIFQQPFLFLINHTVAIIAIYENVEIAYRIITALI